MNHFQNQESDSPNTEYPESCQVSPLSRIHPNVILGEGVVIDDYCVIGYPPKGVKSGELSTKIGSGTMIRSHAIIYAGVDIGANCHLGHNTFVREHTCIGNNVSLGIYTCVEHHCTIGNDVRIQAHCGFGEYTIIEQNAWIGPKVLTANVFHPTCERAKECLSGPLIRQGAIIGGGVSIAPDVEIGAKSFVGLGAIVIRNVAENTVVTGNPAKPVGTIDKMPCRYDMIEGDSPYSKHSANIDNNDSDGLSAVNIQRVEQKLSVPMNDLALQQLQIKHEVRLALDKVILNTRYINGLEVKEFEADFAEYCGVQHAIGVSSGTDALVLALHALNVGPNDEVITTSHTFIATAEAILSLQAKPVFVDIDPDTYHLDPVKIKEKITDKTKVIVPVHIHGQAANMEPIMKVAREHGLAVVEDAAQAHGAEIAGRRVGQFGDITCFSFFPGKNLGAYGDAGGIVTPHQELAELMMKLRDHGRVDKYVSDVIGYNARLDTLQAAILKIKLRYLEGWTSRRQEIAQVYLKELQSLPIALPKTREDSTHVYHHFVIKTDQREALQQHMKAEGVSSGIHYPVPMHLQPAMKDLGFKTEDLPITESTVDQILTIPLFPEMNDKQIAHVVDVIRNFFN